MGRRAKKVPKSKETMPKEPSAIDPENRLQQLSGLALSKIEERMLNGKATGAELIFMAKFADPERFFKQDKIATETELLASKRKAIDSEKNTEKLYEDAIRAMKHYQGDNCEEL